MSLLLPAVVRPVATGLVRAAVLSAVSAPGVGCSLVIPAAADSRRRDGAAVGRPSSPVPPALRCGRRLPAATAGPRRRKHRSDGGGGADRLPRRRADRHRVLQRLARRVPGDMSAAVLLSGGGGRHHVGGRHFARYSGYGVGGGGRQHGVEPVENVVAAVVHCARPVRRDPAGSAFLSAAVLPGRRAGAGQVHGWSDAAAAGLHRSYR